MHRATGVLKHMVDPLAVVVSIKPLVHSAGIRVELGTGFDVLVDTGLNVPLSELGDHLSAHFTRYVTSALFRDRMRL